MAEEVLSYEEGAKEELAIWRKWQRELEIWKRGLRRGGVGVMKERSEEELELWGEG
jgi:hypothetical protein